MIALVAQVQSEFEWPKYLIYNPSLEYIGSIGLRLLLRRSRNCLPFTLEA